MGAAQSGNGNRDRHFDRFKFKSLHLESLSDFTIPNLMELSNLTSLPSTAGGLAPLIIYYVLPVLS